MPTRIQVTLQEVLKVKATGKRGELVQFFGQDWEIVKYENGWIELFLLT